MLVIKAIFLLILMALVQHQQYLLFHFQIHGGHMIEKLIVDFNILKQFQ